MLLGNYTQLNANPGRNIGGFSNSYDWMKTSNIMKFYLGDAVVTSQTDKSAFNNGYNDQYAWSQSPKSGGLAIYNGLIGTGLISNSNLAGGLLAASDITSVGTLNSNILGLSYLVSSLTGIGTLSFSQDIVGSINASANLIGQGDLTGALGALVNILADLNGSSVLAGEGLAATFISANLAGQGDIISSIIGVVEIIAALSGQGLVNSDGIPQWRMIASILNSGALTSSIQAYGDMFSDLQSSGTFTSSFGASPATISSDISAIGAVVTPESVAAAVWSSLLSQYNDSGTMGEAMNNIGLDPTSPWNEIIEGTYTAGELLKIISAILAGETSISKLKNEKATVIFKGVGTDTTRVTADMDKSERKNITTNL